MCADLTECAFYFVNSKCLKRVHQNCSTTCCGFVLFGYLHVLLVFASIYSVFLFVFSALRCFLSHVCFYFVFMSTITRVVYLQPYAVFGFFCRFSCDLHFYKNEVKEWKKVENQCIYAYIYICIFTFPLHISEAIKMKLNTFFFFL